MSVLPSGKSDRASVRGLGRILGARIGGSDGFAIRPRWSMSICNAELVFGLQVLILGAVGLQIRQSCRLPAAAFLLPPPSCRLRAAASPGARSDFGGSDGFAIRPRWSMSICNAEHAFGLQVLILGAVGLQIRQSCRLRAAAFLLLPPSCRLRAAASVLPPSCCRLSGGLGRISW